MNAAVFVDTSFLVLFSSSLVSLKIRAASTAMKTNLGLTVLTGHLSWGGTVERNVDG
jgi:hypothetical protein